MKAKAYLSFFLTILVSFILANISTNTVLAAVISPDKYYIDVDINSTDTYTTLLNISTPPSSTTSKIYKIEPVGIKKIGENNERLFYTPDRSDLSEPANWITINNEFITVDPFSNNSISWSIKFPSGLTCATYYAGIAVSEVDSQNLNSGTQVAIANRVIAQIHINVMDSVKFDCKNNPNLILQEFKTTAIIPVFNYHNIEFLTTLENNSDYLVQNPKGFIELFGIGEKITLNFNPTNLDIYPKTLRSFNNIWIDSNYPKDGFLSEIIYEIKNFRFGIYTARLGITKNLTTPIISEVKLLIIPWRVILLFIIIIVITILFLRNNRRLKSELKSYKENVNAKYKQNLKSRK